jgi:hypothetical protein
LLLYGVKDPDKLRAGQVDFFSQGVERPLLADPPPKQVDRSDRMAPDDATGSGRLLL